MSGAGRGLRASESSDSGSIESFVLFVSGLPKDPDLLVCLFVCSSFLVIVVIMMIVVVCYHCCGFFLLQAAGFQQF